MNKYGLLIMLFFTLLSSSAAQELPYFTIMTEPWPPWQIVGDGPVQGIAADLMISMLERTGSSQNRADIQLKPWARSYYEIQNNPDTILFSMTRTMERENLFKWVGPIFQNTTYLIAKKDRNIEINSPEDIRQFQVITLRDDVGEQYLKDIGIGFSKMERSNSSVSMIRMLMADRGDLAIFSWDGFISFAEEAGADPDLFEIVFLLDVKDIYYAFHKETPDWIIQNFQAAFDELLAEGKLEELKAKYHLD